MAMIYPFERVPLPDISGFIQPRNGVRYFFAYIIGLRRVTKSGKSAHPAAKMIGHIETSTLIVLPLLSLRLFEPEFRSFFA